MIVGGAGLKVGREHGIRPKQQVLAWFEASARDEEPADTIREEHSTRSPTAYVGFSIVPLLKTVDSESEFMPVHF